MLLELVIILVVLFGHLLTSQLFALPPLTSVISYCVPPQLFGTASGVSRLATQIGASLGLSFFSALLIMDRQDFALAEIFYLGAGITLVKGDLRGILRARQLSRATMRNIRQNLFFAFVYNSLGVPVAAGVLYPVFGLLLSPMIAAAAMSLSSVSVISNALRLRKVKV